MQLNSCVYKTGATCITYTREFSHLVEIVYIVAQAPSTDFPVGDIKKKRGFFL